MEPKKLSLLAGIMNFLAWAVLAAGAAAVGAGVYGRFLFQGGRHGAGFYDILLPLLTLGAVVLVFLALRLLSRFLKSKAGPV